MKLYDFLPSGNAYKVRLLLSHLGIKYERIETNTLKKESHSPEYLAKNPQGYCGLAGLNIPYQ